MVLLVEGIIMCAVFTLMVFIMSRKDTCVYAMLEGNLITAATCKVSDIV